MLQGKLIMDERGKKLSWQVENYEFMIRDAFREKSYTNCEPLFAFLEVTEDS